MSADNANLVKKGYDDFRNGDLESLLSLYSEDIEWILPEMEKVPVSGKRKGLDQVRQFFKDLDENQEALSFEPREFIAQGDRVVVLGRYEWRIKATGRNFSSDFAHVYRVKNGKITSMQEYTDTAAAVNANQKAMTA